MTERHKTAFVCDFLVFGNIEKGKTIILCERLRKNIKAGVIECIVAYVEMSQRRVDT